MFRRKQLQPSDFNEFVQLRRKVNDLEAEQTRIGKRLDPLTQHYPYRVAQEGDIWKAYVVRHEYGRHDIFGHEVPGRTFYGATKASAVKKLKTELLLGTAPSFSELTK